MSDYSELKRLAHAALASSRSAADTMRFVAAANPLDVLDLIAENEALRKDAGRYRKIRGEALVSERDNGRSSYYWITDIEKSSFGWGGYPEFDHETLDAAIDAMGIGGKP